MNVRDYCITRTKDGEWEEDELIVLCQDECYFRCEEIQQDISQGKNVAWRDKTLLNPMDLFIHVFGDICLCDKYNELGGLNAFENWLSDEVCNKIAANKYQHYVEG